MHNQKEFTHAACQRRCQTLRPHDHVLPLGHRRAGRGSMARRAHHRLVPARPAAGGCAVGAHHRRPGADRPAGGPAAVARDPRAPPAAGGPRRAQPGRQGDALGALRPAGSHGAGRHVPDLGTRRQHLQPVQHPGLRPRRPRFPASGAGPAREHRLGDPGAGRAACRRGAGAPLPVARRRARPHAAPGRAASRRARHPAADVSGGATPPPSAVRRAPCRA